MPDTFAPSEGDVTEIDGAVLSNEFRTFTEMVFVALFPAASVEVALKRCVPSDTMSVSQLNAYGAATKDVTTAPSIVIETEVTAVLSDALTPTETDPETVAPLAGERNDTVGGLMSTC